jgi:hypothetical protein
VLLTNALARELMASSGWGISKKYKPVTVGSTLGATTAQDFAYAAKALKPYSPVHLLGARNAGDLTITWKRSDTPQRRLAGCGGRAAFRGIGKIRGRHHVGCDGKTHDHRAYQRPRPATPPRSR